MKTRTRWLICAVVVLLTAAAAVPAASEGGRGAASVGRSHGHHAHAARRIVLTSERVRGLGRVLAAGRGHRTVYVFMADRRNRSACHGVCASVWPPVTTTGSPRASGGSCASHLGTIKRGRVRQLTCRGRPLYWFSSDRSAGDARGEGIRSFGARWYALSAAGRPLQRRHQSPQAAARPVRVGSNGGRSWNRLAASSSSVIAANQRQQGR